MNASSILFGQLRQVLNLGGQILQVNLENATGTETSKVYLWTQDEWTCFNTRTMEAYIPSMKELMDLNNSIVLEVEGKDVACLTVHLLDESIF